MAMTDLAQKLEALLFALGRPLSRKELVKMLERDEDNIANAITELHAKEKGGIALVDDGNEVELRVDPQSSECIEKIRKEEYSRDIGKAGLEALAAILYRGPLARSEIDFIRGVNSSQTLRTLTLRGLVRRVEGEADKTSSSGTGRRGSFLYEPTTELLSELGVTRAQDLPDYANVQAKLLSLEETYRQKQLES